MKRQMPGGQAPAFGKTPPEIDLRRNSYNRSYFGGLTDLGRLLGPAVFCQNPPLREQKHNADKTDKAADKRTDNLDECRRPKNTYKR
jgi:hypothetical protein